jgi:thiol-disulfide isomerase/thioredoxin
MRTELAKCPAGQPTAAFRPASTEPSKTRPARSAAPSPFSFFRAPSSWSDAPWAAEPRALFFSAARKPGGARSLLGRGLTATLAVALTLGVLAAVKVGEPFPDLATFGLEGKMPATLKDKVVMVDFWASWCEPCKASFPVMEELHKKFGPQGLVILAINVDENRADMEAFLKKNPASFTILRDAKQKLVEKVEVGTMPTSFLLDGQGKVRFVHSGFRGEETKKKYQQEIETLLKK